MKRAGSLIGTLKLSSGHGDAEVRARAAWEPAAGKNIARHTLAASLVRGTLIVEVEDMLWQQNLNKLRSALLRNLAEILGEPLVTELAFRPMPRRIGPQRAVAARPALHPGDESGAIHDPVLAALYRQSRKKQA
jgi:predicted nucleic acid-binding Zn ribbon protein